MIPRSAPVVKKLHFSCVLPSRELSKTFRRLAFYLVSAKESQVSAVLTTLVMKVLLSEEFSHGNSKHSPINHYRTCPSVLNKMSTVADLPSNVYKKQYLPTDALQNCKLLACCVIKGKSSIYSKKNAKRVDYPTMPSTTCMR